MTEIEQVAGEWFRLFVRSDTNPRIMHLVDLTEYEWNGACSCQDFQFHKQKHLEEGLRDDRFTLTYQCKHMNRARFYFTKVLGPILQERIERRVLPDSFYPRKKKVYVINS